MIQVRSSARRALLRVRLIDRIEASDFTGTVTPAFQRLLARHQRIELMVLDVRRFAGWGEPDTFDAQICFLRACGRATARVAVLGCDAWRGAVPAIAALFVEAEVRAFTPAEGIRLRDWMRAVVPTARAVPITAGESALQPARAAPGRPQLPLSAREAACYAATS